MSGLLCERSRFVRRGFQVMVYERVADALAGAARHRGAAGTQDLSARARAGGGPRSRHRVMTRVHVCGATAASPIGSNRVKTMTHGSRVSSSEATLPADCYVSGMELRRVEQDADGVTAHFADGTSAHGDLLVAPTHPARRSPAVSARIAPLYAGYTACGGLIAEVAFPPGCIANSIRISRFACRPTSRCSHPVAGPGNDLRPGTALQFRLVRGEREQSYRAC